MNADLPEAITVTRRQRDDCADKVDALAKWRSDAAKRQGESK
jgi:hypothetical protein